MFIYKEKIIIEKPKEFIFILKRFVGFDFVFGRIAISLLLLSDIASFSWIIFSLLSLIQIVES